MGASVLKLVYYNRILDFIGLGSGLGRYYIFIYYFKYGDGYMNEPPEVLTPTPPPTHPLGKPGLLGPVETRLSALSFGIVRTISYSYV